MKVRAGGRSRVWGAVMVTLVGCNEAGGEPMLSEVSDSAGVRIVEVRGSAWTEDTGWRVGPPLLELGGLDVPEDRQLYQVRGATLLPDGHLVVASSGSSDLRFYDSSGELVRTTGRAGQGPGEFGRIWSLTRIAGDSLLVWDPGNMRFSLHEPDGTFVRSFKFEANADDGTNRFPPMKTIAFQDGSFLGVESMVGRLDASPGLFQEVGEFYLFDRTGSEVGYVGSLPAMEWFVGQDDVTMANGRTMRQADLAVFGAQLLLAAGDSTFWWNTGGPVLSRFHRTGRLIQRVRRTDLSRTPVTDDLLEQEIEARVAAMEANIQDEAALNRMRERLRGSAVPDTVPVYGEMSVDRPGHLWVERIPAHADPDAPTEWDVFEPEGRFLGTVELPPGLQLFEIGEDYVVGLRRDELDLEYLLLLPLVKPGGET